MSSPLQRVFSIGDDAGLVPTAKELLELGVPRAGITAAAILALVNLLVLARGVHLG